MIEFDLLSHEATHMVSQKKNILSGIQPSGQLILGNYVGALSHWVKMQDEYNCYFMLADLHTLTVTQAPHELRQRCYDFLALYIACGIDPEKNVLFAQSHVPAHTQLAWVLSCSTQLGELNRMTQFKDKSQRHESNINAGLLNYPILMAADILLYDAHLVPVGEDQKQHLELTRDLAARVNHYHGDIFTIPEPYIPPHGARIMSLQEPTKKMSKSDVSEQSYIALLDTPDVIRKKFKRAVTDSGAEVYYDTVEKPGISNLLTLLSIMTRSPISVLEETYRTEGYGKFKTAVGEAVVEQLLPIQARYHAVREDTGYLTQVLKQGAEKASCQADAVMKRVYDALGLILKA
jgi:tryptophanyl-tRNA synthetase